MFKPTPLDCLQARHPLEWDILSQRLGRAPVADGGYRYHSIHANHQPSSRSPLQNVVRPEGAIWSDQQHQFVQWLEGLSSLQIVGHARGRVAVVQLDIANLLSHPDRWPMELAGLDSLPLSSTPEKISTKETQNTSAPLPEASFDPSSSILPRFPSPFSRGRRS